MRGEIILGKFSKKLFVAGILTTALLSPKPSVSHAATTTPTTPTATTSYKLTILHTNDTHSHVEMYPYLTTAINTLKNDHTLLLDGGDVFDDGPPAVKNYFGQFKGLASAYFMNQLGYDATTFGNHEFSKNAGTDTTALSNYIKYLTNVPVVSSNVNVSSDAKLSPLLKNQITINDHQGGNIYPAIIKEVNGQKIGIFGLLETMDSVELGASPIKTVSLQDYTTKAQDTIKALQDLGIDKIVVLSHMLDQVNINLAKTIPGIDIIVGGHEHTRITGPRSYNNVISGEKTVLLEAGDNLERLGVATITFDGSGRVTGDAQSLVDPLAYTADSTAQAALDQINSGSLPQGTPATDTTAPVAPTVDAVTDQATTVTGTAEANSTVEVKANNTSLGTATADATGKFSVAITAQAVGTALSVTATDAAGNVSTAQTVTVQATPVQGASIQYSTHVQSYGWQNSVTDGALSGTVGQAKRLESIKISVKTPTGLGVKYSTHVQSKGWLPFVADGAESGTVGEAKRLEAIKMELTGAEAANYDIYYRVQAQTYGWMNWVKNGAAAGTSGEAKRLEAIEIKILPKGSAAPSNIIANAQPIVGYSTHVQSIGWQSGVSNGALSGTTGLGKRLEAIKISLSNSPYSGGISYSTHVQTYGWQNAVSDGALSGTQGQSKRLEAIKINLTGEIANYYDIYYRVHAETFGWLGWAKNGMQAGTAGYGKRLEAIEIKMVPKGTGAAVTAASAFKQKK